MGNEIQKQWEGFVKQILPADAGWVQRREMRRAFFQGAIAMSFLFGEKADDETITEAQGVAWVQSIKEEFNQFLEDLKTGKA